MKMVWISLVFHVQFSSWLAPEQKKISSVDKRGFIKASIDTFQIKISEKT